MVTAVGADGIELDRTVFYPMGGGQLGDSGTLQRADGGTVAVELSETVDDGDGRLHTDETVVFDVAGGLITKVAVYLQTSEHV